jgi:hypothetical protein
MALINPLVVALATTYPTWTGTVFAVVGATAYAYSPQPGESIASVWISAIALWQRRHGGTWAGWINADGRLVVTSTLTHTLGFSGLTETRLGAGGGSYTGATEYTLTDPATGVWGLDATAIHADGVDLATSATTVTGDGGGAPTTLAATASSTLVLAGPFASIDGWAARAGEVADVLVAGRVLGRIRLREGRSERHGELHTVARAVISVEAVRS